MPKDVSELLRDARDQAGAGRLPEAYELCREAARLAPADAAVLHAAGAMALRVRELDAAEDFLARAVAAAPAAAGYCNDLGIVHAVRSQPARAEQCYRKAIALQPIFPTAHLNLGNALRDQGRWPEAAQAYETSIAQDPQFAAARQALGHLATTLFQSGNMEQAAGALARLAALGPNAPRVHYELGTALARLGRAEEGLAHLRRAIELAPDYGPAWCNAALAMEDGHDIDGAVRALAKAREMLPGSRMVEFHLAALGGAAAPPICPEDYVVELFDSYADRFDEHLVARLNYRGPQLLFDAVMKAGTVPRPDVIDLGCGTGLCGVLFRTVAGRLVGVDLSPKMIEKSRERGVYDELLQLQIVAALESRPSQFDVALAADVFIYAGDLRPVFAAAAKALHRNGLFAFTLETVEAGDFVLRPSRRYAQSLDYIRRLSSEFGFAEVSADPTIIRSGEGPAVEGAVVVLRRG